MRRKKNLVTGAIFLAAASVIALGIAGFERSTRESGTAMAFQYLSDGWFTVSILYIGCSILMFIQEAGNFYGVQFLFYTLVHLFSPGKDRTDHKKTYFAYCQEKRERQAAEGKSPVKAAMLLVGIICLALSVLFALLFYKLS